MEIPLQVYTSNLDIVGSHTMFNNNEISVIITAALITMISTTVIAERVEARFCATPNSPIGQVADKLIKLQQGMLLLQPNNQTIKQGIANLTSTLCKPGETMSLFGNQSATFKTTTNLTTPSLSANSSVSKVQNTTGLLTKINRVFNIPVEINQFTQGWSVNNVTLYLNRYRQSLPSEGAVEEHSSRN